MEFGGTQTITRSGGGKGLLTGIAIRCFHAAVLQQRDDAVAAVPDAVARAPDFVSVDLAAVGQVDDCLVLSRCCAGRDWIQT